MKKFKFLFMLPILAVIMLTAFKCGKENAPINALTGDWECILEQWNTTITLRIDAATNLVTVSKTPKEHGSNDGYHQFRDGNQYLLQNDTLHLITPPYDSYVFCEHFYDFAITRLSENTMELEYLGGWWAGADYMTTYLFNKSK